MVKKKKLSLASVIVILILLLFRFSYNDDSIYGTWIYVKSENGILTYKKTKKFQGDKPSFFISRYGVFEDRQDSGWCGTPPLTFNNYKGRWKWKSDSILWISYKRLDREIKAYWKIIEQSETILKIEIVDSPIIDKSKSLN